MCAHLTSHKKCDLIVVDVGSGTAGALHQNWKTENISLSSIVAWKSVENSWNIYVLHIASLALQVISSKSFWITSWESWNHWLFHDNQIAYCIPFDSFYLHQTIFMLLRFPCVYYRSSHFFPSMVVCQPLDRRIRRKIKITHAIINDSLCETKHSSTKNRQQTQATAWNVDLVALLKH